MSINSPFSVRSNTSFMSDNAQQIFICDKSEAEYLSEMREQQNLLKKYQDEYNDQIYEKDSKDLRKGMIRRKYKDGSVYEGQVENKKRHGLGKFIRAETNQTYVGEWKEDRMEGNGLLYFENGEFYKGPIMNGKK